MPRRKKQGPVQPALGPKFCDRPGCGNQVTRAGRVSPSGKRYCSNPKCRSYRDAERYERTRKIVRADAPTECSACKAPLPARKTRRTDSPLGRWCHRASCQRHRSQVEAEAAMKTNDAEANLRRQEAELSKRFAIAVITSDRVRCEKCAIEDAIPGFVHPDPWHPGACHGVGDDGIPRELAEKVWPHLFNELVYG